MESALVMMEAAKKAALASPKHLKPNLPPSEHPNAVHQDVEASSATSSPGRKIIPAFSSSMRTATRGSLNLNPQNVVQKNIMGFSVKKVRGVDQLMSVAVPNIPSPNIKPSNGDSGSSAVSPIPGNSKTPSTPGNSKISPTSSANGNSPVVHYSPASISKPTSANGFALNDSERANQHVFRMADFTPPPRAVSPRIRSDLFRKKESPKKGGSASSTNSNSRF